MAVDGHGRGRGDGIDELVKLPVSAAVPALPLSSCQLVSTETSAVLMSVPALAVKVAV